MQPCVVGRSIPYRPNGTTGVPPRTKAPTEAYNQYAPASSPRTVRVTSTLQWPDASTGSLWDRHPSIHPSIPQLLSTIFHPADSQKRLQKRTHFRLSARNWAVAPPPAPRSLPFVAKRLHRNDKNNTNSIVVKVRLNGTLKTLVNSFNLIFINWVILCLH